MKLSWSQGTAKGDYLPSSEPMHDNNEKLTSTLPKEQPTDAESGWEKLESWRKPWKERQSLVINHCTESLPLFPSEHKEDHVLEFAFIPRTLAPPTGVKQASNEHEGTRLRGAVLLETKAAYELAECAAFASQSTAGPTDHVVLQHADSTHTCGPANPSRC